MPGVLLRALSEYKFVSTPLWRMSDGKDLVQVELTFHKKLPTSRIYKKGAESRRQPAPLAGEWPRQPAAASRPPPRREPTLMEGDATTTTTDYNTDAASDHHTTRILLLSPHRRLSPYQHQHQRLQSHCRRRIQEKSLRNQRKIAQSCAATTPTKNLSRSTRSTTSRMLSATNSMEKTLPSSRPKDSREKKT